MKMLTSEQVNGMLERSHDYNDRLKNVKYFDSIISNFYLHPERIDGKLNEHETRKRYSEKTKMEMREHFLLTQNYAETARTFIRDLTHSRTFRRRRLKTQSRP